MIEISDYDEFDYDYSTYWKNRDYENKAEHLVLEKVFDNIPSGEWLIDIGGSYGRLTGTYSSKFKHPVIVDYSFETLQRNRKFLKERYPNIILIAANAYFLPFQSSSIDTALMVRVLHHLNKPDVYFKELRRILKSNGTYIQEFANKIHIKARIKALTKGDLSVFSIQPYQQPTAGNFEGSKGQESIFLNFHPRHVKKLFRDAELKIVQRYGCSFLRIPLLKEKFKTEQLVKAESFLQKTLSWTNIPPSIFFVGRSQKEIADSRRFRTLEEILVCPKCRKPLRFSQNTASCSHCGSIFTKENDIWDFRVR